MSTCVLDKQHSGDVYIPPLGRHDWSCYLCAVHTASKPVVALRWSSRDECVTRYNTSLLANAYLLDFNLVFKVARRPSMAALCSIQKPQLN
jgi:hypothetical protein